MSTNRQVIILGAGITGLSAGWKLAEGGCRVKLIESFPYLGGMASTFRHKDYCLDYGPHKVFTVLEPVMREIQALFRENPLLEIRKKSRIRLRGKYLNYPLAIFDVFSGLGLPTGMRCGFSYAFAGLTGRLHKPPEEESYEDWVVSRYGRTIYNLVLGPYAAKIWGDPRQLSKELAESRIASPSLLEMVRQMLLGKRKRAPVISAEVFHYPRRGAVEISERMAERILARQGEIKLHAALQKIDVDASGQIKKIVYADGGCEVLSPSDALINTLPISRLAELLGPALEADGHAACSALKTRKLILLFVAMDQDRIMEDNWLFFPEGKYRFNRVFEQKAFNSGMVPSGRTVLCLEITCADHDDLWRARDDEVFAAVGPQMKEAGILDGNVLETFTRRIETAYPVYDKDYRRHLNAVMSALDRIHNLYSVGRQGGFSYTGMADSMDIGFTTSDYILRHDVKDVDWPDVRKRFYNYVVVD